MKWRLSLEPSVRAHLEKQISDTGKYKDSYFQAKDPSKAQLWCAVTNLSMQVFDLNVRLHYLEDMIKKLGKKKVVKKRK